MHRHGLRQEIQENLAVLALTVLISQLMIAPSFGQCPTSKSLIVDSESTNNSSTAASNAGELMTEPADEAWLQRGDYCYRYVLTKLPWYPAEKACRTWGGHLVSIRSQEENQLVSRLTDCRGVWIGRFATEYYRVSDPSTYKWTDSESDQVKENSGSFQPTKLNKTAVQAIDLALDNHAGALRAENRLWFNTHYHERLPFVCKTRSRIGYYKLCQLPMEHYGDHCYWLSDFATSFVDANLYCEEKFKGHLASVHSQAEAKFIATLELNTNTCHLGQVWIGLIRQQPCRRSKNSEPIKASGACYRWTDLSGELSSYPHWASGHLEQVPDYQEFNRTNCATFSSEGLRSERCYRRYRFVCKVHKQNSVPQKSNAEFTTTMSSAAIEEPGLVSKN